MPDDLALRLHLAQLLLEAGQRDEAVRRVGTILQRDPANTGALALLMSPDAAGGGSQQPRHDQAAGQEEQPAGQRKGDSPLRDQRGSR